MFIIGINVDKLIYNPIQSRIWSLVFYIVFNPLWIKLMINSVYNFHYFIYVQSFIS